MLQQQTLALLKPDLLANPYWVQQILKEIRSTPGIRIVNQKQIHWTPSQAQEFYHLHQHKFFYRRLITYMTSGPLLALRLEGPEVIGRWRQMIGSTHPIRSRLHSSNCLRARYGLTDTRNSFHGSDSVESAVVELKFIDLNWNYLSQHI